MSPAAKLVPTWVRIVAGFIALLNMAYGLSGYFSPASILPGLSANTAASLNAAYIFSARNVAIGVALMIVSFVGVPETIAIVMIIRFLIESQDLVLSIIAGNAATALLMPTVFIVVELTIIVTMFKIVGERQTLNQIRNINIFSDSCPKQLSLFLLNYLDNVSQNTPTPRFLLSKRRPAPAS